MKGLYSFGKYGRGLSLSGIFIADSEQIRVLTTSGIWVCFGEIAGKHSWVEEQITDKDVSLITTESNVLEIVSKYGLENGENPFEFDVGSEEEWEEKGFKFDNDGSGVLELVNLILEKEGK
jgi:hypothetical protein